MDLDGDGDDDVLSGSYSRTTGDMAGLFFVLHGNGDGTFGEPAAVTGDDGEPLIIAPGGSPQDELTAKICTRPTAVDLDGDGHLDIVSGNFAGTFATFHGAEGGTFDPVSAFLRDTSGDALTVDYHSDPCFADWDGDGDLDLLSGSDMGGVFLFPNVGTRTEPRFGERVTLVPAFTPRKHDAPPLFGTGHIRGPHAATRVTAADVDGDGKLDLLVGDAVTIHEPAKGLTEAQCLARLDEWKAERAALRKARPSDPEAQSAHRKRLSAQFRSRADFLEERRTGHVWLYRRR